jgi:threonine synthase
LPGDREGPVQSSRLPRPRALSGVNSINWARIVAQVVYYFTAAVALGAPHRKVAFTVPTGNFGDIFAGYVAKRMGLPIERLVDRHQRQRHPGAHAEDRHL